MAIRMTFPQKIQITPGASLKATIFCSKRGISRPDFLQALAAAHVAKHQRNPSPRTAVVDTGLFVTRLEADQLVIADEWAKDGRTFTIMTARDFLEYRKLHEHKYQKPISVIEEQDNANPEHHTGGAPPE